MLLQVKKSIDQSIQILVDRFIFTNFLGLSRAILALSTLLTLIFNNPDTLFSPYGGTGRNRISNSFLDKANFFYLLPYNQVKVLILLAILILLLVISGFFITVTSILHFWICVSFINAAILIEGGDQIASNLSLLLIPICFCDPRHNHWERINNDLKITFLKERNLISNYFLVIIRLQVAFIYFHAAIGKMGVEDWINGTAIYYWFNNPTFGMSNWLKPLLSPILESPYTIVILTWGVIFFEFSLFIALFLNKKYYLRLLVMSILFHFLIVIVHGLFSFFLAMSSALIFYLAPLDKTVKIKFKK